MLRPSSGAEPSGPSPNSPQPPGFFVVLRRNWRRVAQALVFGYICYWGSQPHTVYIPPSPIPSPSEWLATNRKRIESTRRLLARLEWTAKEIPQLKKYLQKLEDDGVFSEKEFRRGGSRFRLGELWQERKEYPVLFWTSELKKRRAKFEDAVLRGKVGNGLTSGPDILQTYEFAGKLLGLPVRNGLFVETTTGVGPEAVLQDLQQIKEGVSGLSSGP